MPAGEAGLVAAGGEPPTDTSAGTSALARDPVASGLELRPTTTEAGACVSLCHDPLDTVPFAGARTVASGRVPHVELRVPCPAVAAIGAVTDVGWPPAPLVLDATGRVTETIGPRPCAAVEPPVPVPPVPGAVPLPPVPGAVPLPPVPGAVPLPPVPVTETFRPAVVGPAPDCAGFVPGLLPTAGAVDVPDVVRPIWPAAGGRGPQGPFPPTELSVLPTCWRGRSVSARPVH
jgi:hypothetical protein